MRRHGCRRRLLDHLLFADLLHLGLQFDPTSWLINEVVKPRLDGGEPDEADPVLVQIVHKIENITLAQAFLRIDELRNALNCLEQVSGADEAFILFRSSSR